MLALSNKANTIVKEALEKSQNQNSKPGQKEKKGGRAWLEEMVTKQEIIDRVGIVDPIIQPNIESTLTSIAYTGKTKAEVTNDIVTDLEKQVERLKYQRVKMLQEKQKETEIKYGRVYEEEKPQDIEEEMFAKALKNKDLDKMEDIVEKRRQKLEEMERKWREKREIGEMRESGILESNNLQNYQKQVQMSQKSILPTKISTSQYVKPMSPPRASPRRESPGIRHGSRERPLTQAYVSQDELVDTDVKDILKESEKLRVIDPRRSDFQMKVSRYLVEKGLKKNTEEFFESKEKKNFDKFKSPGSFRKSQEFEKEKEKHRESSPSPISHLPAIKGGHIPGQTEKENRQNNSQVKSPGKVNKKKVHDINELFIIKLVFDALNHKNEGTVSKDEVLDYVMTNQDIVTIFDLKSSFNAEVLTFPSETVGRLNFHELTQVMMKRLPQKTQNSIKSAFPSEKDRSAQVSSRNEPTSHQDMLLTQEDIDILSKVFENLDQYEDLLLKTEDYLKALRNDLRIQKIINKPAVKVPVVNRELTVAEILDQIETEMTSAMEHGVKTMQYISWNQFLDYFKTYKPSKFTRHPTAQAASKPQEREEEILLSPERLQIVQDVFDSLPRVAEDYVDKIEFVKAAKRDPQIQSFWKEEIDIMNQRTVGQIFDSILASEVNYLKWEETVPFFTAGGGQAGRSPTEEEEGGVQDSPTQTTKKDFPTFAPDHISEAAEEDLYGDEAMPARKSPTKEGEKGNTNKEGVKDNRKGGTISKEVRNRKEKSREPNKEFDALDAELRKEYEMLQEDLKAYGVVKKNLKDDKGLTIPKPFKFQQKEAENKSIRQQKLEKMVEEKKKEEEDALSFKFKANELPAYVKVPMYNTIKESHEERRREVTEKSKQITLANQKPFSFDERERNKVKSEQKEEAQYQFKSNPVPQFAKLEVVKEKEEKEKKEREERIKKRMEENIVASKLPPRMELHEKAKKEGTLKPIQNPNKYQPEEATFKPKITKELPDFEKLQGTFNEDLQKKKKDMPKTQFQPFEFQKKEVAAASATQLSEEKKAAVKTKKIQPAASKKPMKKQGTGVMKKPQTSQEVEEGAAEEQEKGEEVREEEEYPADEDHQEEGTKEEDYNQDEEAKGEDGDLFKVESQELGDEAVNPNALGTRNSRQSIKDEPARKSEKSEKGGMGTRTGTMGKTGGSEKGDDKKKPILTKKLEQEFERRKRDKEAYEKRMEDMKREEEARRKKEKEFAPKVMNAFNTVNKVDKKEEENKEKHKEFKERMKQEQEDYNERIKEMKTKVDSAPLMIENKLTGSKFLKKYRDALARGWDTLEGPLDERPKSEPVKEESEPVENYSRKIRKEESEPVEDYSGNKKVREERVSKSSQEVNKGKKKELQKEGSGKSQISGRSQKREEYSEEPREEKEFKPQERRKELQKEDSMKRQISGKSQKKEEYNEEPEEKYEAGEEKEREPEENNNEQEEENREQPQEENNEQQEENKEEEENKEGEEKNEYEENEEQREMNKVNEDGEDKGEKENDNERKEEEAYETNEPKEEEAEEENKEEGKEKEDEQREENEAKEASEHYEEDFENEHNEKEGGDNEENEEE